MNSKYLGVLGISLMIFGFTLMVTSKANAQEYKVAKSNGRLEIIEVNRVTIEPAPGNEIIFKSLNAASEKDERAEGLRAISAMGLEDNSGIGLSVVDKGNVIEVQQLKRMDGPKVLIQVPKGVIVSYRHTSPYGNSLTLKNLENEIEISTVHSGVKMENVTGPMTVETVHGKVEVVFNAGMKSPISLVSVHGLIDVTMPLGTKANLSMNTGYGEIFVDPAFKIDFEKTGDEQWRKFGSGNVKGKLNGGGIEMSLSSTHGTIYLRKK